MTAEEAVGQQGRSMMTAPLVALLGLRRDPLINLAPARPSPHKICGPQLNPTCTRSWQALLTRGQTHIKDINVLCMHKCTLNGLHLVTGKI